VSVIPPPTHGRRVPFYIRRNTADIDYRPPPNKMKQEKRKKKKDFSFLSLSAPKKTNKTILNLPCTQSCVTLFRPPFAETSAPSRPAPAEVQCIFVGMIVPSCRENGPIIPGEDGQIVVGRPVCARKMFIFGSSILAGFLRYKQTN
jgi:hypothetical protein